MRHDTLPKIILQGIVECNHHRGMLHKSFQDIKYWTDQSLLSLLHLMDYGSLWEQSQQMHLLEYPQRRLGVTGIKLISLVIFKLSGTFHYLFPILLLLLFLCLFAFTVLICPIQFEYDTQLFNSR